MGCTERSWLRRAAGAALLPAAVAAASVLTAGLPVATASAAARKTCAHHSTQIVRTAGSTLWTSKNQKTLYSCTSFYEEPPHDVKLGSWTLESMFAFDGSDVAWTTHAHGIDKVWIADAAARSNYTWMKGLLPTVGHGSSTDTSVIHLAVWGDSAGWVTSKGTVVTAVRSPNDDPTLIGAGTPGALVTPAISPTTGNPQGLVVAPPKANGHRMVIGRWENVDPDDLGASLTLKDGPGGDGDECGGVTEYLATVKPIAGQPAVGTDWYSDWSSDARDCG